MILKSFRIKNYRSILDTGWNNLSTDNVTALIGQNESGKTSVLEALKSFFDGKITDDILRSNLSMPQISCVFQLEDNDELRELKNRFPQGVWEKLNENGQIHLTRSWNNLNDSRLLLEGDEIIKLYAGYDNIWQNLEQFTAGISDEYNEKHNSLAEDVENLEQLVNNIGNSVELLTRKAGEIERQMRKMNESARKELLEKEAARIEAEITGLEQKTEKSSQELKTLKEALQNTDQVLQRIAGCIKLKEETNLAMGKQDFAYGQVRELEKLLARAGTNREYRRTLRKLEQYKELNLQLSSNFEQLRKVLRKGQLELKYLLESKDEFESARLAEMEYSRLENVISREDAAEIIYGRIPHFELFEDFSSLLPNRIDLDDLFLENIHAEGYKAVKNFLVIAGLDPEFFTQSNNRILKQKIENLNNELTINFQDYWRQCIGKTNKIQIAFEMEHYDFQDPEKKGKPYLEFWIKDEQERLYPKQRSRGVRWFLSFYLELKASAKLHAGRNRMLLIDEPGLSLHARAQEDVLKVFEDIRAQLQVIYTTHSPHLIDLNKLFRILAVQRAHEAENSQTVIFDPGSLHAAARDTLSPIYSLMGVRLSEHEFIRQKNNILVENTTSYYYLSVMMPLAGLNKEVSFLPATGSQSLHLLSNLMLGWGLEYYIIVFDNAQDRKYTIELEKSYIAGREGNSGTIILEDNAAMVEDMFSTLDFKKHIINKRVGIPETNAEYIFENNLSRVMLASSFAQKVKTDNLQFNDFDEETRSNFGRLAQRVNTLLT